MKKLIIMLFVIPLAVSADEVGEYAQPNRPLSELWLVAGVLALGILFYVRYRRERNKS